jgi:hypothetical protein
MEFPAWLKNFDAARWWQAAIVVGIASSCLPHSRPDRAVSLSLALREYSAASVNGRSTARKIEIRRGGTLTTYERANRPQGLCWLASELSLH